MAWDRSVVTSRSEKCKISCQFQAALIGHGYERNISFSVFNMHTVPRTHACVYACACACTHTHTHHRAPSSPLQKTYALKSFLDRLVCGMNSLLLLLLLWSTEESVEESADSISNSNQPDRSVNPNLLTLTALGSRRLRNPGLYEGREDALWVSAAVAGQPLWNPAVISQFGL